MGIKGFFGKLKSTYLDNDSISNKEQLGFAGGIFGNAMGQDSVDTFSDKFDRNFMGIPNNMMIVKGNVSTILSFFIPPVAGTMYDYSARAGKKSAIRTAIKIAPIPFALTSMLLFIVPTTNPIFNFIWSLYLSILFSISDTFYDIALNTLALKMVKSPPDRKKFFTFESIASTLGSMAPGTLIPIIVGMSDKANIQQWLYFFVALGFCIIGVLSMYAPYLTIAEKFFMDSTEREEKSKNDNISWNRHTIGAILHNRPFMIIQAANICEVLRQITYKILPYLYDDTLGNYGLKALFDNVSGPLSYVGLLSVPFLGKKLSSRGMLILGYSYSSVFYLIMSLFNINFSVSKIRKLRYVVGTLIGLSGAPNAMQGAAKRILVADSTDYMEWYSKKKYGTAIRSDGLLSATQNIVNKANALIKANLYNFIFSFIGYLPKDLKTGIKPVQSDKTLHGIFAVASICGFLGNVLPAICYLFDNYTGQRKKDIYEELCQMRKLREENATNESIAN